MILRFSLAILLLLPAALAFGEGADSALKSEMQKIDARAANPDTKAIVVAAMADELNVHRNHLVLLRKQTAEDYSRIFVATLEKNGLEEDAILGRASALNREIDRRLRVSDTSSPASIGLRPVATISTGFDHNSAGNFYWLLPEVGIASKRASFVVGVPYYRNSGTDFSAAGVGDIYATGALYAHAWRTDFETALTVGFPTGDENLGLGAGKVTADISGTVARSYERVRPFLSAGFANSIANFGYARPYVADGNAAHFSGGLEIRVAPRLEIGVSGFGVKPFGSQVVYSRTMMGQSAGVSADGSGGQASGGGMPGMGGGMQGGSRAPITAPQHMPFLAAARSVVAGGALEDYGPNAWVSITAARGVAINIAVTRSVPFHLTTVGVGLTFDLAHALRAH